MVNPTIVAALQGGKAKKSLTKEIINLGTVNLGNIIFPEMEIYRIEFS